MLINSLKDADIKRKKVLLRAGFDVPLKDGIAADETRIRESLPTIQFLLNHHAQIILMSHLGRPEGRVVPSLSLAPAVEVLKKMLPGVKMVFVPGSVTEKGMVINSGELPSGEIIVLDNVRFCPGEETNEENFARQLASLGQLYVNDAFSVVHRRHASVEAITHWLPSYAGLLLEKEVTVLSTLLENPRRPYIAIIGGAKISTKLNLIAKLLQKVDILLLGGALANNILKAQGVQVGRSLIEEKMLAMTKTLSLTDNKIKIPVDVVVAREISEHAPIEKRAVGNLSSDQIILDIGPDTVQLYRMIIDQAQTIVWNGPMGYFEIKQFAQGTNDIAQAIGRRQNIQSIVGGGETLGAISSLGIGDKFSFISTGGGAMLEFLEGKILPGIKPLIKV